MRQTNVIGATRVARAVRTHAVPAFIVASSVGTYAEHSKDGRVDETWAATGISSSTYSRHKADVESMLDEFESLNPTVRVVRMRTSLVFQRARCLGDPSHLPRASAAVESAATASASSRTPRRLHSKPPMPTTLPTPTCE